MKTNPLLGIPEFGQSIWLDFISRSIIKSGELKQMIDNDGLRGVTSNPAIFENAINSGKDYDEAISALSRDGKNVDEIYEILTVEDVGQAADLFRDVYKDTAGRDGYVSLEVSPHLARDTEGTLAEARHLWAELNRPNVFIKVPATREGLPAIQALICEGINVNVTLLFSLERYQAVAEAYVAGLEERASRGESLKNVASVASFFLSRIDSLVDPMLEKRMKGNNEKGVQAKSLHGQTAIASAKSAYRIYEKIFHSSRFRKLADLGAATQRLLWASTSTKNPEFPDVKYVEALIGPDTVNTIPLDTLNAYRDHGDPAPRLTNGMEEAEKSLKRLAEQNIDLAQVTQHLEDEGVEKFNKPFDKLMAALRTKVAAGGAS